MRESETPTPYAVVCLGTSSPYEFFCNNRELIFLTEEEYALQLNDPDQHWKCPRCGGLADWDDDNYEKYLDNE